MSSKTERKQSLFVTLDRIFHRKTVRGFAGRVRAVEDLAVPVQEVLQPYLEGAFGPSGNAVEMILTAPAQSVLGKREGRSWWPVRLLPWEITPNRVLVLTKELLLIASSPYVVEPLERINARDPEYASEWSLVKEPPEVDAISLRDILLLEFGSILLISWIEITWVHKGQLERSRIYFNSVSRDLFSELLGRIRLAILANFGILISGIEHHLDRLEHLPYKFKSLIPIHLLLPGEQVQAVAYRPSIWEKGFLSLRRHVAPKMVVLRTDGHLILAREDLTSEEDSYGLIAQFCPLPHVTVTTLEGKENGLELVIHLEVSGVDQEMRCSFPVGFDATKILIK